MLFFQGEGDPLLADAPPWVFEGLFWLAIVAVLVLGGIATGVGAIVLRLRAVSQLADRLSVLEELQRSFDRLIADRDDLDLRRIEHVLIDIREGQKHLDDAFLRSAEKAIAAAEQRDAGPALDASLGASGSGEALIEHLAERVTNRMLAMGYERIEIATGSADLETLAHERGDGVVLVEARREGVLHKGRVHVRGGRLQEVDIQPTYSIFP